MLGGLDARCSAYSALKSAMYCLTLSGISPTTLSQDAFPLLFGFSTTLTKKLFNMISYQVKSSPAIHFPLVNFPSRTLQ